MNRPDHGAVTVSELTKALKRTIEDGFSSVCVRGEVSNLRRQPSGHCYFSLKDEKSQISAVLFRGNAARIDLNLVDGQQILVFGELSVYEPRGSYQIIVRDALEDGVGRLQRDLELLKEKLKAEGLFDAERKKALPSLPLTVGVITSASGAALQDMLSVFRRRDWRGSLRLFPSLVQGESAVGQLVQQIERAGKMEDLDLLVITRGGGSLEDLWSFNSEKVARAFAASSIPTISAVGHEIDFVLTDYVADLRKETPTGAAEWISSLFLEARTNLNSVAKSFSRLSESRLRDYLNQLRGMQLRTTARPFLRRIENYSQRVDDARDRVIREVGRSLQERFQSMGYLQNRLVRRRPDREWLNRREKLEGLARRLDHVGERQLKSRRVAVEQLVRTLRTGGLDGTLRRGFVVARDENHRSLGRVSDLEDGDVIGLRFYDGSVSVRVQGDPQVDDSLDRPKED